MTSRDALMFNLVKYRKASGLTQAEFAKAAGISARGYGKIERGEVFACIDTLDKLADALGITAAQLLTPPEMDIIKIVRCRMCKYYNRETGICKALSEKTHLTDEGKYICMTPYDFCSCGDKLNTNQ